MGTFMVQADTIINAAINSIETELAFEQKYSDATGSRRLVVVVHYIADGRIISQPLPEYQHKVLDSAG